MLCPSPADHQPVPADGSIYSWHSLPSDGITASDYPLSAICETCHEPVTRQTWRDEWVHREKGAPVPVEPAFTTFRGLPGY